jgi:hypothetical protein
MPKVGSRTAQNEMSQGTDGRIFDSYIHAAEGDTLTDDLLRYILRQRLFSILYYIIPDLLNCMQWSSFHERPRSGERVPGCSPRGWRSLPDMSRTDQTRWSCLGLSAGLLCHLAYWLYSGDTALLNEVLKLRGRCQSLNNGDRLILLVCFACLNV